MSTRGGYARLEQHCSAPPPRASALAETDRLAGFVLSLRESGSLRSCCFRCNIEVRRAGVGFCVLVWRDWGNLKTVVGFLLRDGFAWWCFSICRVGFAGLVLICIMELVDRGQYL
jgi:hypothetical protein